MDNIYYYNPLKSLQVCNFPPDFFDLVRVTHHAEGLVNPKVRAQQKGYWFWMPQSM
jgi:hypothetical protein